jgi:hypothetical protein
MQETENKKQKMNGRRSIKLIVAKIEPRVDVAFHVFRKHLLSSVLPKYSAQGDVAHGTGTAYSTASKQETGEN